LTAAVIAAGTAGAALTAGFVVSKRTGAGQAAAITQPSLSVGPPQITIEQPK
jgi:hypothetical protein